MANGNLINLLASIEIARIELEYASADIAAQAGLDRAGSDCGHLDTMLSKLRLARAALAIAQETLDEAAPQRPDCRRMAAAQ